jgi:SAM-dependent methyltransferase
LDHGAAAAPARDLSVVMHTEDPSRAVAIALQQWYSRPLGALVLDDIRRQLDRWLPRIFGYHLVMIGGSWASDRLLAQSRIRHKIVMGPLGDRSAALSAQMEALPFAADSLDLVVLFHALEFASEPHQVLREIERVLIPEGHLILVSFNPFSFWGLRKLLGSWRPQVPWSGHFYAGRRLKDWMLLLGLDLLDTQRVFFRPPIQRMGITQRLRFLEPTLARTLPVAGGINLMIAAKRVVPLTPVKPRWRPRRSLVGGRFAEPSTRGLPRV